jgi:hypothetical protein
VVEDNGGNSLHQQSFMPICGPQIKVVPQFEHLLALVLSGRMSESVAITIQQFFANSLPGSNTRKARTNWHNLVPQLTKRS